MIFASTGRIGEGGRLSIYRATTSALQIGVLAATRVLESLGVLSIKGEVQRLNLLDCRLIEREST